MELTTSEARPTAPDPAMFWAWMGDAIRPRLGWILTVAGAVAIAIGYLGVSDRVLVAEQLPYLVSGGIGGMALVIVGGVFLATDDTHRNVERIDALEARMDELHAMVGDLHAAVLARGATATTTSARVRPSAGRSLADGNSGTAGDAAVYALPSGSTFHRGGCSVLQGKPNAAAVTTADVEGRGLHACALCSPTLAEA